MNLFDVAHRHLEDNGLTPDEADTMMLWWGSVGLGRLWKWEDETPELSTRQIGELDTAALAWINRGKPQAPAV